MAAAARRIKARAPQGAGPAPVSLSQNRALLTAAVQHPAGSPGIRWRWQPFIGCRYTWGGRKAQLRISISPGDARKYTSTGDNLRGSPQGPGHGSGAPGGLFREPDKDPGDPERRLGGPGGGTRGVRGPAAPPSRPSRWSPWRTGSGGRRRGRGFGGGAAAGAPSAGEVQAEGRSEAAAQEERERRQRIQEALAELDALVGLTKVKALVRELQAYVEIQRLRRSEGLAADPMSLHMIFQGNPGTGKTTVARTLGRIFRDTGVLTKGHIIEAERADLVGEYIGHTAQKTREVLRQAAGGILFVDEAYSLARGGEKDFGKEAIDTLVKSMEDNRDKLLIILAGYPDEMTWFASQNPGLRSRLPIKMTFPDYTPEELMEIALIMLEERQYELTGLARSRLRHIVYIAAGDYPKGNARTVRNLIEGAVRRQAVRLSAKTEPLTRTDLKTIDEEDLRNLLERPEFRRIRSTHRPGAIPPYSIPFPGLNGFPQRL